MGEEALLLPRRVRRDRARAAEIHQENQAHEEQDDGDDEEGHALEHRKRRAAAR